MFLFHRLSLSQELKKAPTPPAQLPPPPVTPAPPQPQVNSHQRNTVLPTLDLETTVSHAPIGLRLWRDDASFVSSPQQMLRRGRANGTRQFRWPWPSPPSSPQPQRCPPWSPWRPPPLAPRPRLSRPWAPSWRRPSSEQAGGGCGSWKKIFIIFMYVRGYSEGSKELMDSLKLTQKSPPDQTSLD